MSLSDKLLRRKRGGFNAKGKFIATCFFHFSNQVFVQCPDRNPVGRTPLDIYFSSYDFIANAVHPLLIQGKVVILKSYFPNPIALDQMLYFITHITRRKPSP